MKVAPNVLIYLPTKYHIFLTLVNISFDLIFDSMFSEKG
jgi:hypothetical protein